MALEPIRRLKSLYIMLLATYPYQKLPTDFSEEAEKLTVERNAPRWMKMLVKYGYITTA
uniref:Uncharacterized protein n=2 Tax=Candidatus Kentrum sp. SD TaxID=2126332 RepID=A0A451BSB5_9GAMM|nr:MAG: hypothetical protein BECKSD772D_GA0070982_12511 [Candidatus Kentron sp. SD]